MSIVRHLPQARAMRALDASLSVQTAVFCVLAKPTAVAQAMKEIDRRVAGVRHFIPKEPRT